MEGTVLLQIDQILLLLPGIPARTSRGFLGYCSVALLPLGSKWALFDTGHYGDRGLLLEALEKARVFRESITHVILSHLHYDHCLNISLFPNARLFVGGKELQYLRDVQERRREDTAIAEVLLPDLERRNPVLVHSELAINPWITLFEASGHTPGSIAARFVGEERIVLCGDAIKNAWEFSQGVPDQVRGQDQEARESIQKIREMGDVLVPGHDRPFRLEEGIPRFLGKLEWSVWADVYPGERYGRVCHLET